MGPEWLPDVESDLRKLDSECYKLMANGSFDEETFTNYFQNLEAYLHITLTYHLSGRYDESRMKDVANYYNEHTNTSYYYDPILGKRSEVVRYHHNNDSNDDEKEDDEDSLLIRSDKWARRLIKFDVFVGFVLLTLLLLRGCTAHGEKITDKYILVDNNGKKIEFMDNNFQIPNDDYIDSMDYPVKTR